MSFTFPGEKMNEAGTRPIELKALIKNIGVWAENERLGTSTSPTYKSSNKPSAYFWFLKKQKENFDDSMANEFKENPDIPKFADLRKYMIIFANVLLRDYCDLNIGAREVDYKTICDYDGVHDDLKDLVGGWAREIDANNDDVLTEIYVIVDNAKYPIAFYSGDTSSLMVFPFNTINSIVRAKLIGWDENAHPGDKSKGVAPEGDYTMAALLSALDSRPMSARALYAALMEPKYGMNLNNLLSAFASWLQKQRPDVLKAGGAAYSMEYSNIPVDETTRNLSILPVPKMPVIGGIKDDLFSEQLLIIKSNTNVKNGEFGLCTVDNIGIGILDTDAPKHAVVPPLSPALISKIYKPGDGNVLEFQSCSVLRNAGQYNVTITLSINGASCTFSKTYDPGDVKKCDNFPLIALLTQSASSVTPARLYRADYTINVNPSPVYLDGRDIAFGKSGDQFELQFDKNLTVNNGQFGYSSVGYHDPVVGRTFYCGYLLFASEGQESLYNKAQNSTSTAVIIDDDNDIAQIAVLNTATMEDVTSYNVYNDRILFIHTNNRDDLDRSKLGRCWGVPDETIFSPNGDGKYALAPFSKEFAGMVARGEISIASAQLRVDGDNWIFSVDFNFGGKLQKTAPRVYTPDEQFTMPNPPFFYAVETIDAESAKPGYEIVRVANMGLTKKTSTLVHNGLDSNELIFKIGNYVIDSSRFVEDKEPQAYIQIYGDTSAGEVYYGQISLDLAQYTQQTGFNALKDESTNCAAILLIMDQGLAYPKKIITGTVFDDNLFLIAKEPARAIYSEYRAWRSRGLVVEIADMTAEQKDEKEYEAVFPFSLKMLQNLNDGSLNMVEESATIKFNSEKECYEVSVQIAKGGAGQFESFTMEYEPKQNKVVKCDNLPFVISVADSAGKKGLARFNNEIENTVRDHIDGSKLTIEVVSGDERTKLEDGGKIVDIPSDSVVLRLSIPRDKSQASCHMLYQATDSYHDGVYSLQSEETGTQHVVDYNEKDQTVTKLKVFTDYIMWSLLFSEEFANGTPATKFYQPPNYTEDRLYSIPVTMSFTSLMERRGLKIASYSNVKFYNKGVSSAYADAVSDDYKELYVTISLSGLKGGPADITKVFPVDRVIKFETYILPTLTVFPYVNFIADASFGADMEGKPLWQQYTYAKFTDLKSTPEKVTGERVVPLGSRVDFWVNGQRIDFKARSTKFMLSLEEDQIIEMKVGTVTGWGKYIHMKYDGSADVAPPQAIDSKLDGQEFGCIIMMPAPEKKVSAKMTATVGVDFGTRNSIIAIQPAGAMNTKFPYHGKQKLQQIIVPEMSQVRFDELSNLCYIPHFNGRPLAGGEGCGKFASTVMTYANVMSPDEKVEPYDLGFVPNVQGNVLKSIMDRMGEAGAMGDVLGFYSDLKISTDENDPNKIKLMNRNVRTFIKSIMFHTVLNCYQSGCGDISIRFSVPSKTYATQLGTVWNEACDYINSFIPAAAQGMIHVGDYQTEAVALFEYLKTHLAGAVGGMPKYSAITDGGDGTYDFTINKFENGKLTNPASFSLRYAGQQIMTDSVNTFYDHLVARNDGYHNENVRAKFREMWQTGDGSPEDLETLRDLVEKLSEYRESGGQDREKEKTLALMLVEQFGIDCQKMGNRNARNLMDIVNPEYVNFVRMIQYKFLFLFNILGEQIRRNIHLDQEAENSFNIYLYGGTAQALAIAEPLCKGNLGVFSQHASKLPMAMFIDAILDLPNNIHGAKYVINFLPAADSEKREIASGLIAMSPSAMPKAGKSGSINIPSFGVDDAVPSQNNDFGFDSGFGFGGGFGGAAPAPMAAPGGSSNQRDAKRPQTLEQFVDDLKNILESRTVKLPQGEYCIDRFLLFSDEKNNPIKLSEILDDSHVRNKLAGELSVMWTCVCNENPDIDDSELLYHIYTLKMVGVAIEAYLRK